jgi:tRNA threonylcarbamoyladenosine biosynthesis protein TsaB
MAVRELLAAAGVELRELRAVGVVRGPGSFTGVRAGLAAAKGLCEAAGLRMVAVSRLAVLADAATMVQGVAALDAGRGQLYLREQNKGSVREWLGDAEAVRRMRAKVAVVAEEKVAAMLEGVAVVVRTLGVLDALPVVRRTMEEIVEDAAAVDALYLREEAEIYGAGRKTSAGGRAGA